MLDINDFAQALESVFSGKATILNRMRLALSFYDAEGHRKGKKGDGEHDISVPDSRFPNNSSLYGYRLSSTKRDSSA